MSPLETRTIGENIKLQLWERLELQWGSDESKGIYSARVEDMRPEGIMIDRPIWMAGEPSFDVMEPFLVTIFREDGAYRFKTSIINSLSEKGRRYYIAEYPKSVYRLQRRGDCRVDVDFSVNFIILTKYLEGEYEIDDLKEYSGISINLSASGILFESKKVLGVDDLLAVSLIDAEMRIPHPVLGIVRRLVEAEREDRIRAGVQFIPLEDSAKIVKPEYQKKIPADLMKFDLKKKQKLMQYVFNYQVKLRQKGLI